MAEFFDVMKQVGRMCASVSCNNCILPRWSDEMCIWQDAPAKLTGEVIAEIEAKTLKWAAENPEVRYPTWQEWQRQTFPDASLFILPCTFMGVIRGYCSRHGCHECAEHHIPADIAKKLGIEPITKVNNTTTKEVSQ